MSRDVKYLIATALGAGLGGYIIGRAVSNNPNGTVIEDRTVRRILDTIRTIAIWA